jgi:lysozyme
MRIQKKTLFHIFTRPSRKALVRLVLSALLIAGWWQWLQPGSVTSQLNAIGRLESHTYYVVRLADGDSLLFSPTTHRTTDAEGNSDGGDSAVVSGCFVSARGHFVTTMAARQGAADTLDGDTLRKILTEERQRLEALAQRKASMQRQLDYYAGTHSVTDDGYNDIMKQRALQAEQTAYVDTLLQRLAKALAQPSLSATLHCRYTATLHLATRRSTAADTLPTVRSYACPMRTVGHDDRLLLLQTSDGTLPATATYLSLLPALSLDKERRLLAYDATLPLADVLPLSSFSPDADSGEGAAVTDARGHLKGLRAGGCILPLSDLRRLCFASEGGLRRWGEHLWGLLRRIFLPTSDTQKAHRLDAANAFTRNIIGLHRCGDNYRTFALNDTTSYSGRQQQGRPEGYGVATYRDGSRYRGCWHDGRRSGEGVLTDSTGTAWSGCWQGDTLTNGVMTTTDATYRGDFDRQLRRHGNGILVDANGSLYEGQWVSGVREGFGYDIGNGSIVRAGSWHNNTFRGERFIYTAERVYGIDISRYQHEIGRKRYAIDWSKLRITNLGASNAGRIRGTQDYPVSFVYIKATQGTTVTSRYYSADAAACRRRGIPVGAYHFFSTTSDGLAQARHFIRTAGYHRGDLPPVLDVEPGDAEIQRMGGTTALFREVTAWLRYVRRACGIRPVLYISQGFVNKYMAAAPEEVTACPVWIARYSEYKPYVQLLHWQHSANGRVAGIHGAVDINVFNGNAAQFATYLREIRGEE